MKPSSKRRHWAPPRLAERPAGARTFAEVRALPALRSVSTSTLHNWLGGKSIGRLPPQNGTRGAALYALADVDALVARGGAQPRARTATKPRRRIRKGSKRLGYDLSPGWETTTSLATRLGLPSARALDRLVKEWNDGIRASAWPVEALGVVLASGSAAALTVSPIAREMRIVAGRRRGTYLATAVEIAARHGGHPPIGLPWRTWAQERILVHLHRANVRAQVMELLVDQVTEDVRRILEKRARGSVLRVPDVTRLRWKLDEVVRERCAVHAAHRAGATTKPKA